MTARELETILSNLKPELRDKEIMIVAQNGLTVPPEISFIINIDDLFDKTQKTVDYILLK